WNVINAPQSGLSDTDKQQCLSNWVVDILPYIDQPKTFAMWDFDQPYLSTITPDPTRPYNLKLSSSSIPILSCPSDPESKDVGNLSYVVNGGFSRWHAIPQSWTSPRFDSDPQAGPGDRRSTGKGDVLAWVPPGGSVLANQDVTKKLGVLF